MTLEDTCTGGRDEDDEHDDDEQVNLTTTEQSPRSEVPTTTLTSSSLACFSPSLQANTRVNLSPSPSPSLSLSREEHHQVFATVNVVTCTSSSSPAATATAVASSSSSSATPYVNTCINSSHVNSSTQVKQFSPDALASSPSPSSSITSSSYTLPQVTVTNSSPITPLRTVQSTETLILSSSCNHQLTSLCTSSPDLLIANTSTSPSQAHHSHSSACKSEHFTNQPVTCASDSATVKHLVTSVTSVKYSPPRHSTQVTWTPCNVTTSIVEYNKRLSLTHSTQPPHAREPAKSRSKSISHQLTHSLVKSVATCSHKNGPSKAQQPEAHPNHNSSEMSLKSDQECNSVKCKDDRGDTGAHDKWLHRNNDDSNENDDQLNQVMVESRKRKSHQFDPSNPASPHSDHDAPIVHESIVLIERETWDKKTEFLLAVIGFAVDLGNVSLTGCHLLTRFLLLFRVSLSHLLSCPLF